MGRAWMPEGAVAVEPPQLSPPQPATHKRKAADLASPCSADEADPPRKCAHTSGAEEAVPVVASAGGGEGGGLAHGPRHKHACRGSFDDRMHPRNRYFLRKPDFKALAGRFADFAAATTTDSSGRVHVDWKDPNCSIALTRALLSADYGLCWDLPRGFLCPPVPQRANYVHWIEDLLAGAIETAIKPAHAVRVPEEVTGLDIGVGASAIYPLLALSLHPKWKMIGTDINEEALRSARANIESNGLQASIRLQLVSSSSDSILLQTVQQHKEQMDFCMCNPPFFAAEEDARKASHYRACDANVQELVTPGGEQAFVSRMIADSKVLRDRVRWYTTMVGHKSSLAAAMAEIKAASASLVRSTTFYQGKTIRWAVAWSFEEMEPRCSSLRFASCAAPAQLRQRLEAAVCQYGGLTLEWPTDLSHAVAAPGLGDGDAGVASEDDERDAEGKGDLDEVGHADGGGAGGGGGARAAPASYMAGSGVSGPKWPVNYRSVAQGTVLRESWTRRARRAKVRQAIADATEPLLAFVLVLVRVGLRAPGQNSERMDGDGIGEGEGEEWIATVMLDGECRMSRPVPAHTARLFDSLASMLLRHLSCPVPPGADAHDQG
jgi:23S rRNA A1618 N6-methylase RlmF